METTAPLETQTLLELLERAAFIGTWTFDLPGDRLSWSAQLAQIHGLPAGFTPARRAAFDFYAPEWRDRIRELVEECADRGAAFDEEMQIVTSLGQRAWVRTVGQAVRDESGEIL